MACSSTPIAVVASDAVTVVAKGSDSASAMPLGDADIVTTTGLDVQ